jgi:predicted AAA+ superfamily ATPase
VTHKARRLFSTLFEARNAVSHMTVPLNDAEALSYLFAMQEAGALLKVADVTRDKLRAVYDAQRHSDFGGSAPAGDAPAAQPASPAVPTLSLEAPEPARTRALRPWIDVALPHPDVLANRFKESEFAADLFAVDSGKIDATSDYATPKGFFEITFLTEGLKRVLSGTMQRLAGVGGDPVIGLQTSFGGGKTHTMLAAYHLAKAADLAPLPGLAELGAAAGVTNWKPAKVATFVGSSKGADTPLIMSDGPKVYTLWGFLGWRLAGQAGLDLMAEAEAARTNPGSELLVALFNLSGPALILLDEVVAYARQLSDERFEAFLSFIQSLTEAAKMAPGIIVIGSLPESDIEAGGDKGVTALRRLQTVFGRVNSPWLPAAGDETYEIIRRRLFQTLDAEGEKARDETVKAFHDMYRKNAAEFPPAAKDARYQELLKLSYPIHPELFERLSKDWASLEKFQRTRGVLRFMANVIGVLWHAKARDPLIMLGGIPIANERVRASVLYPLPPAFGAVVDKEVDGDGSLPQQMETNPTRRITQFRAATRASRAVFMSSAALSGQPNAGLNGQGLRLACAEPEDQLAIFGEALRELSERATFLYEEAGRYWFSTQPTLNRMADERARGFANHEVDADIVKLLTGDARTKGGFHRVFAAPDDPTTIDEAESLSLVMLAPSTAHAGKAAAKSPATDAVTETLTRCRAGQRRYRNTLFFVAADDGMLATAREATRRAMAWAEIAGDQRLKDQLPPAQMRDAAEKAKAARDGCGKAIRAAWSHIIYPVKTEHTQAGRAFDLEQLTISTKDRAEVPVAVYEKIGPRGDNVAKEKLGPDTLWINLKPLWPDERPHLPITEVSEWYSSYVYLPKIKDSVVLQTAIRDGVGKLDPSFGYADGYDAATDSYRGLAWAKSPPEVIPDGAVIVRTEAALAQLAAASAAARQTVPGHIRTSVAVDFTPGQPGSSMPPAPLSKPTRFFGVVELDMVRPVKAFDAIITAVITELQRNPGSKVKLTLEVEAELSEGFEDTDIGIVRDNARQLKFKADSTGFS